jgi:hypothetical protein
MSSPAKAIACAAAGARKRSTLVAICELTQPLDMIAIGSTNAQIRIIHPLMGFGVLFALCVRHGIRADQPDRQKLPNDLADDRNNGFQALRFE